MSNKNLLKTAPFSEIVCSPYKEGALVRDDFPGFREDYLVIHSLIRKYKPRRFFEIGTSSGGGTRIICNAVGLPTLPVGLFRFLKPLRRISASLFGKKVYSLDVPPGTDSSIIYPSKEDGHPAEAGSSCDYRYTQLFGDSTSFDFSPYYPLDAWFIDGKHNYEYAKRDTEQALKSNPRFIIWHDVQIEEVERAVFDVMRKIPSYKVYKVQSTRIAFAVKEQ